MPDALYWFKAGAKCFESLFCVRSPVCVLSKLGFVFLSWRCGLRNFIRPCIVFSSCIMITRSPPAWFKRKKEKRKNYLQCARKQGAWSSGRERGYPRRRHSISDNGHGGRHLHHRVPSMTQGITAHELSEKVTNQGISFSSSCFRRRDTYPVMRQYDWILCAISKSTSTQGMIPLHASRVSRPFKACCAKISPLAPATTVRLMVVKSDCQGLVGP